MAYTSTGWIGEWNTARQGNQENDGSALKEQIT
jgi:hypothetical protein